MKILIAILIILFLPSFALGHGFEPELQADPGKLPGEIWYVFERPAEWIEVNLLTLSTKKKEEKKLQFSSERVAEMGTLLSIPGVKEKHLKLALKRYQYDLASAEDMAEKIIFLDGKEIGVAEKLEQETRLQEKFLRELKESASIDKMPVEVSKALAEARTQNEKMFRFMVEKYQANEEDIRKHRLILTKHMTLVREALQPVTDEEKITKVTGLLDEAEKFRNAGLNLEAYDLIKKAKDLIY